MEKLPLQQREAEIQGPPPTKDERTFEIAIASGVIVDRWWGREQLLMDPGAVVMDRAGQARGIPLLFNHDTDELIGRLYEFRVDPDGVARGKAVLASSECALECLQLIIDGALVDVSVGYRIHEINTVNPGKPDELNIITKWEPYEVSMVSIPADATVGVGRGASETEYPVRLTREAEAVIPNPPAPVAGTPEVRMEPTTQNPAAPVAAPPINVTELQSKAAADALAIRMIADKFGLGKEAEDLITERGIEGARTEIMGRISDLQPRLSVPVLDLTAGEAKQYSLTRAINAAWARAEGRSVSGFEVELDQDLRKKQPMAFQDRGGLIVPMQLRAGLDSLTSTKGNELKFTEYGGELIELLRNKMVVTQMGGRTLSGLTSPIGFPAQTAAATAYWVGENPTPAVTASTLSLVLRTLIPKTLQATTTFSRQLLQQAVYGVEQLVREDFVAVHARAYDLAAIHGTGSSNDPTGIYKTANVNTQAMGGVPDWAKIVGMVGKVLSSNALTGALGYASTPLMAAKLATVAQATNYPRWIWEGRVDEGTMAGYKAMASNQIASVMSTLDSTGGSEHGILFGNWSDVILGLFGAAEIIVDPYTLADKGMIKLTSFQMADVLLRHPGSFCVATGATIS